MFSANLCIQMHGSQLEQPFSIAVEAIASNANAGKGFPGPSLATS